MSPLRSLSELNELDQALVRRALTASGHAYAPYSGFAVGAAVRSRSGQVFVGANLENASYGVTICAEVAAITAANSAGCFAIEAIAVVGHRFRPPTDVSLVVAPCGRCRQIIAEASHQARFDTQVLSCSGDLRRISNRPISELLPDAFGPANLGLVDAWIEEKARLEARVNFLERQLPRDIPAMHPGD